MMRAIQEIIDEVEAHKRGKQSLLALVRGGHARPKGMTQNDAIRLLLSEIAECDEFIAECKSEDSRADIEWRSRLL
jgi:hypothetical protein